MEEKNRECSIYEMKDAIIKKTLRAVKAYKKRRIVSIEENNFLQSLNSEQMSLLNKIKKQLKDYYINDIAQLTIEVLFEILYKIFNNQNMIYFD